MLLGPRAREQHKRHFFVCSGSCRPRVTCSVYTVTSDVLLAFSKPHAHPAAHGPPAALQGLATPHPTPHPTCTAVLLRCRSGYCLKSAVWSHVLACTWQGRGREGGRPGVGGGRPRSDGDGGRGGQHAARGFHSAAAAALLLETAGTSPPGVLVLHHLLNSPGISSPYTCTIIVHRA